MLLCCIKLYPNLLSCENHDISSFIKHNYGNLENLLLINLNYIKSLQFESTGNFPDDVEGNDKVGDKVHFCHGCIGAVHLFLLAHNLFPLNNFDLVAKKCNKCGFSSHQLNDIDNEMELCKEYIWHKLLWYIEMCLKGNKFTSGRQEILKFEIDSEIYIKFIAYIYFWILQEKVFQVLLEFDSYSFFSVLILFFTEPEIIKIINNYDFSTINADLIQKLIDEQENNTYFLRNMENTLKRESTLAQEEQKPGNQINESVKVSKTIIPSKSKMDIQKEEMPKEVKNDDIKEENKNKKEEKEKKRKKNQMKPKKIKIKLDQKK